MLFQFECANRPAGAEGGKLQTRIRKAFLKFWIYAVAALVRFDDLVGAVDFAKARSFLEEERFGLVDKGAGEF